MQPTPNQFQTPILFLIFSRPDTTRDVFAAIRALRPAKLYIAADGHRENRPGEAERCLATREIVENIDWPCEVKRRYAETNQGCKVGVSSAISWFFEHVEEGIILEDDCLPDPSFFPFCSELLEKYREDRRVMMISGDNFQFGQKRGPADYYFSHFCHIWGWATWRRAWKCYDLEMSGYKEFKKTNKIAKIFGNKKMQRYWLGLFDKLNDGKVDTWDGQWAYSIYNHGGLCVIPNKNLVTNIGFGQEATHTIETGSIFDGLRTDKIDFSNIIHPQAIAVDRGADQYYEKLLIKSTLNRIITKLKTFI